MSLPQELIADLKSSHFNFGGYNQGPNHSVYTQNFQHDINAKPPKVDTSDFRKSHLKFGDYQSDNFYVSLKNRDFTNPGKQELAKMNEEKKRDLRSHHFNFGGWGPMHTTTTGTTFVEKQIDNNILSDKLEKVNKMRKHNFELGNSQKHNRSSTYGDQFKPMEKGQAFQGPSKEELKQKMLTSGKPIYC